jgi:phage terminase large subunit
MPRLLVNRKLEPFLTKSKPIKVAIGGRGSGKSIGFGDIFTMKMETEQCDVYCLREFQESIEDSVHRVFVGSIQDRLKLDGWQVQENKVISPFGNRTKYKGASRNPDSIQSAQDYKYSWYEEAHKASKSSLDKLLPTILRNPGAECWFSANPQSRADAFSKRFIVPYLKELERDGYYEDDIHLIVVVNWKDNPWWNDEQEALRKWDYENRPRAEYDWIWEGKFHDQVDGSIIKAEWFDAAIDAHKLERLEKVFKPHGAKVAAHDPFDDGNDAGGFAIRHGSIITSVKSKSSGEIDECCDWATENAIQLGAS